MRPKGQSIVANIGIIIGILGGLIGMAVAIAAAPIPGTILSLVFIIVFGWVFGGLYLRARKQRKLLASGTRANGRILEVYDTGVTVNNQPQVGIKIEVTPLAGPPFTSEIKLVISRLQTAYYQPGATCVVRYDPNDKDTVAIESFGGGMNSGSEQQFGSFQPEQSSPYFPGKTAQEINAILEGIAAEENRLRSIGTESKAIIKKADWTNIYVNGKNEFRYFELAVMPDNAPAFDATCYGAISEAALNKYVAGRQIWVKYDPADKTKVTLSHS